MTNQTAFLIWINKHKKNIPAALEHCQHIKRNTCNYRGIPLAMLDGRSSDHRTLLSTFQDKTNSEGWQEPSWRLRREGAKNDEKGSRRTAELTQILPVSIPRDSLLVSRLKDIQEHGAVNIQNTAMTGLYGSTLFWEICFQKNWDPFYCNLCRCSAAVNFEQHFFFLITNSLKSVTHQQLLLLL